MIEYNGELYDGKHKPIITKKLFDKCQEVMKQKSKPKGQKLKPYMFADFSVAASAAVLSPPKHKRDIIIYGVQNEKIPVHKDTRGKRSSLPR